MIRPLREAFNASWTEQQYLALLAELQQRTAGSIDFPIAETPCFFPRALVDDLARTGEELIHQAITGEAGRAAERVVPSRFRGPGAGSTPTFLQVDFGLVRDAAGHIAPKLVELQAFPSLYGFQPALADGYRSAFTLPAGLYSYLSGLDADSYRALLRSAVTGEHDPTNVVLMEIDPEHQKTRPDFAMTERLWGVRAINTADVIRDGRQLFYQRDGTVTVIRRIYNRVIPDELERKGLSLPFDYRDDLDVEWTGHPEWYFRVSKFSIPFLRHPSVPRTWFLHEINELPDAPERLLLKPLFSFAGAGIVFGPSAEEIRAIPIAQRDQYMLQERVSFEPVIETPYGLTQAEIRMMYVWTDRLRAVLPLVRMGRGKMMGVDHNKGLRWVGASSGFIS